MNTSKLIIVLSLIIFSFAWSSCEETNKSTDNTNTTTNTVEEKSKPAPSGSENLISEEEMTKTLTAIADNMEKQKLMYDRERRQDSPGIFHKIVDELKKQLPALAEESKYQYPTYEEANTTRLLADWYYKNGNFEIVHDPMDSRNNIKVGSVMFYGRSGEKFKGYDIDQLTDRKNNFTTKGIIQHIAVVTEVKKDADGNVQEYTIMHGRRPGKHATRSVSKEVQSTNTKGLPPFGSWKQQWVAMAYIATPNK